MIEIVKKIVFKVAAYKYLFYYKLLQIRSLLTPVFPEISSLEDSISKIINNKLSISRFGDGEIRLINNESIEFQSADSRLREKLIKVVESTELNHAVCLPDIFKRINMFTPASKFFWYKHLFYYWRVWRKYLKPYGGYLNAFITRPYITYLDKKNCGKRFELIKQIWADRDILLIEGKLSRLGVGNDLFENTISVQRILCENINGFSNYDDIIDEVVRYRKECLILLALGPTATVLAYDFAVMGYQAIDIGHIDIEYEWYRSGVGEKIAIKNKYTNESVCNNVSVECTDSTYLSQIFIDLTKAVIK